MGRPGAHTTPEAVAVIRQALATGRTVNVVAKELGHNWRTVDRVKRAMLIEAAGVAPAVSAEVPPNPIGERREARDASYWRRCAKAIERDLADAEHLAEELAGVRGVPVTIPEWLISPGQGPVGRSVVGLLLSDVHAGEVIDPEETLGINAFNPDICRARLRRYFDAATTIGARWASDTVCEGAYLALGGDLTSGLLHEELKMSNALTTHEQVALAVEEIAAGIKHLIKAFGRVHVASVPGNHGRTTIKPTAKLYSRLSYDTLAAAMVQERFANDGRVSFQIGRPKDQVTPIFARSVFLTHGDNLGTKGGMGFAGPLLPIVRGTKKVMAQQASVGRQPDLILHGHYHVSANPGNVLSNGSIPGYSEYASDLRASVEPPQQWLFLLHSKWWLRERMPIQLEDPYTPEKPRVRIPAAMSERAA